MGYVKGDVNSLIQRFYEINDIGELVKQIIDLHFDPKDGSRYWLSQKEKKLDFDPRKDIQSYDDLLEHFPFYSQTDLRNINTWGYIPQIFYDSIKEGNIRVMSFETGGTTGAPVAVPWFKKSFDNLMEWGKKYIELNGIPKNNDILAVVPTGPHLIGQVAYGLGDVLNSIVYTIDLDPRFIKKTVMENKIDTLKDYSSHIMEQIIKILKRESPKILFSTPPLINQIVEFNEKTNYSLDFDSVMGIITGGMELPSDVYKLWREEVFRNASYLDVYGNTLFGGSFSVPSEGNNIDHYPTYPTVAFEIIDPQTKEFVDYGERGQVVFTRLTPECFIPKKVERDIATKISAKEHEDVLQDIYEGIRLKEVVGVRNVENIKAQSPDGKPTLGVY